MNSFMSKLLVFLGFICVVNASVGLVFLGSNGDNAVRPNGVWQGLYEGYCGGQFEKAGGVTIFALMNTPHTETELQTLVLDSLNPLYEDLRKNTGWECLAPSGDCSPEAMYEQHVVVDIHEGRDACAQAAEVAEALKGYSSIPMYLSIPPSAFGQWAVCGVQNWGADRVEVAAEKPFGTSVENADDLYKSLTDSGLTDDSIHLVDHWLSFFMVQQMPSLTDIAARALGIKWNRYSFERIVVKENEIRGLEGRGSFFDGVGQVRDMIQSHLLQVLATVIRLPGTAIDQKLAIFNQTKVTSCRHGQYDGFLLEPKLGYHEDFADATFSSAQMQVASKEWAGTEMVITTGKDMNELLYTVQMFQRNGPGVLTFEIGKEETGVAGIKVQNWPLQYSGSFKAPLGGFTTTFATFTPSVSASGNGDILRYNDPDMYFPKPYAVMISNLINQDYTLSFVSYPECRRSWEIVTAWSPSVCLNPTPSNVTVYTPVASSCKTIAPDIVCWEEISVAYLYDYEFRCSKLNDVKYSNVSFYQAKCHS